jgi:hypothetical protein
MSQPETFSGVGRLYRGQRNLGCVAYVSKIIGTGVIMQFDPVPDGAQGDVFSLRLADGRIMECQAAEHCRYFLVLGDGPHPERRVQRRPTPTARLLM